MPNTDEQTHTPGPWRVEFFAIRMSNGHRIASFDLMPDDDDANLIAAAPSLLAACKLARKLLEIRGVDVLFPEDVIVIDEAIAKAEGKSITPHPPEIVPDGFAA